MERFIEDLPHLNNGMLAIVTKHSKRLKSILLEAGFQDVEVYWEGDDGSGGGNGIFRRRQTVIEETAWIAYVVAWR